MLRWFAVAVTVAATAAARATIFARFVTGFATQFHALGHSPGGNFAFDKRCDSRQILGIARRGNGIGLAQTARAARAANAVHVIFGVRRHVKVEHMADGRNIKPARGHIGCHQQVHRPITEAIQGFGAH